MSNYPILHAIGLGPQLEAMERIVAQGRAGKHHADDLLSHSPDHHFQKADSHMIKSGSHYSGRDAETGEPHLVLAAVRLLMAAACVTLEAQVIGDSKVKL